MKILTIDTSPEFAAGRDAFKAGKTLENAPGQPQSQNYMDWSNGWRYEKLQHERHCRDERDAAVRKAMR